MKVKGIGNLGKETPFLVVCYPFSHFKSHLLSSIRTLVQCSSVGSDDSFFYKTNYLDGLKLNKSKADIIQIKREK